MSKVALKYIGNHAPQEVVEVEDSQVAGLLNTGGYILVEDAKHNVVTDQDIKVSKKK